jgi:hypothetical protein
MISSKFSLSVEGAERVVMALKLADEDIGRRVRVTVARTKDHIVAGAKSRVPKRTHELEGTIRGETTPSGLIALIKAGYGQLKRRSRSKTTGRRRRSKQQGPVEPGIYAMVVEWGDARNNKPAEPYFFPAVDERLPEHSAEIAEDLRGAVRAAESRGGA